MKGAVSVEMDQAGATDALQQLFSEIVVSRIEKDITFNGFRSALEKILALTANIVGQVHQAQSGPPVACKEGCACCCHAQVKATPLEALVLFDWVEKSFTRDQRAVLKNRIENNLHLTEGIDLEHRVAVKDQTPCIFLENGGCGIYPVRPLICRAWTSYSSSACRDAFASGDPTAEIDSSSSSNFVYSLARQTIERICETHGLASVPVELPRVVSYCFEQEELFERWPRGDAFFDTFPAAVPDEDPPVSFMDIQMPAFFRRFSLSYTQDGTCIEYFLYSKEKKHEISTALIVSHDVNDNAINVSRFYPEIYRENLPRYMSAACFFLMMHHAAAIFDIHCDCHICLETKCSVFESFYRRLKDFDFVIHHHRVSDKCNVRGCYHDFPVETDMITPVPFFIS